MIARPLGTALHSPWLDWLRFFAALEVVLTHARTVMFVEYSALSPSSQTPLVIAWVGVTRLGYEAVMVFFVLSGFLVGGRAIDLARQGKFDIATYAIDRLVRILVPLSAAILLTLAVTAWAGKPLDGAQVAGNFLSLQGVIVEPLDYNVALWSLSYEVWFYIVGGAVALMLSRRRMMFVPMLAVIAGIFVFTRLNPLYAILWIGGAVCYFYRPKRIVLWRLALAALIALAGIAVFQFSLPRGSDEIGIPVGKAVAGALLLVGLTLIIPYARMAQARGAKIASFLASFSYSLYLIHLPLLALVPFTDLREVTSVTIGLYALVIVAIMIAAFIFSRGFETTAPAIKRLIKGRRVAMAT